MTSGCFYCILGKDKCQIEFLLNAVIIMKGEKLAERKGYVWVVYALCFLMIFCGLGFLSTTRGIYLAPITEALGISRGAFSIGDSFRYIASTIVNFFFGMLVSRFGTKKLMCAGLAALTLAVIFNATTSGVVGFYISGILIGIGYSWTTTSMIACVVAKWCKKNVGTVMGIILAANGIGGAVSTILFTPIINGSVFGYRKAYYIVAAIFAVLFILVLILYKEKSTDNNNTNKKAKQTYWEGIPLSDLLKKSYFYVTMVCVFFMGIVLQGITSSFAAHLKDCNLSPEFITAVVSLHSVCLAGSKVVSGFVYDKFGLRTNVIVCGVSAVAALLSFAFVSASSFGYLLAFVASVAFALALPLETVMLPLFAGNLFGMKAYNHLVGIIGSVAYAGFAVGVPLMGAVYDLFGSYFYGAIASIVIMFAVTLVFQLVINSSNKIKKEIER